MEFALDEYYQSDTSQLPRKNVKDCIYEQALSIFEKDPDRFKKMMEDKYVENPAQYQRMLRDIGGISGRGGLLEFELFARAHPWLRVQVILKGSGELITSDCGRDFVDYDFTGREASTGLAVTHVVLPLFDRENNHFDVGCHCFGAATNVLFLIKEKDDTEEKLQRMMPDVSTRAMIDDFKKGPAIAREEAEKMERLVWFYFFRHVSNMIGITLRIFVFFYRLKLSEMLATLMILRIVGFWLPGCSTVISSATQLTPTNTHVFSLVRRTPLHPQD
jgi:hypothetical protein